MIYIFDSGPLIHMFNYYYRDRFVSLWERFDKMVEDGRIVSVKEAARELSDYNDSLASWVGDNVDVFHKPSTSELAFLPKIFGVKHFQSMIRRQQRLEGKPVADPFVIAKAKVEKGCVVSTEVFKENASRIPNVCSHFNIPHMNLEEFMTEEDWVF